MAAASFGQARSISPPPLPHTHFGSIASPARCPVVCSPSESPHGGGGGAVTLNRAVAGIKPAASSASEISSSSTGSVKLLVMC